MPLSQSCQRRGSALAIACLLVAVSCTAADKPIAPGTPGAPIEGATTNSADRILFWVPARDFVALTDADLQSWQDLGVDGFVPQVQWLIGMGGGQDFKVDPMADLTGDNYTLERTIRDNEIVGRAKKLGMKLYLAFNLSNFLNLRTPLEEWFDDAGWNNVVLPAVSNIAAAAHALGFDGLAFDQEMYAQVGNVMTASWSPLYDGNSHTEVETRAMVRVRGQQMMTAIVGAFPDVEIQAYGTAFPEGWEALVQKEINGIGGGEGTVHMQFWDGLTSVEGYKAIRFVDAIFYKSPHLSGSSWDTANQYNANRLYALFSRRFSNWSYASSRVFVSPFSWIDAGISEFEKAASPKEVGVQLEAFRKWGTGGEFANFAFSFREFDYRPYRDAIRAASAPAVVDAEAPKLTIKSVTRRGSTLDIVGTATDNLAIRSVREGTAGGQAGAVAQMTWDPGSGNYRSGWDWEMNWSLTGVPAPPAGSEVSVTVEDIKGLATTLTVPVAS